VRNGAVIDIARRTRYRKTEGIHMWLCAPGRLFLCLTKGRDTVGELKSVEICAPHMPCLKAKKLGKLSRENVLLELWRGFANSIGRFLLLFPRQL